MTDLWKSWPWASEDEAAAELREEAGRSRRRWGAYRSSHEAYGVLAEEMMELLQAIRDNNDVGARLEAMQVAAVAFRLASEGWRRD